MKFARIIALSALSVMPALAVAGDAPAGGSAPNHAAKVGTATKDSQVENVGIATALAAWGREHKSPEALIAAAQILSEIPTEAATASTKTTRTDAVISTTEKKGEEPAPVLDPTALLKEAQAAAAKKGDKSLTKYVDGLVKAGLTGSRGASGGAKYQVTQVSAGSTDQYNVEFRGGETAEVALSGDGDTDLDLWVYDEFNNLVASDAGSTDTAYVSWTPRWTGNFRVEVQNRGAVYNQYVLITN